MTSARQAPTRTSGVRLHHSRQYRRRPSTPFRFTRSCTTRRVGRGATRSAKLLTRLGKPFLACTEPASLDQGGAGCTTAGEMRPKPSSVDASLAETQLAKGLGASTEQLHCSLSLQLRSPSTRPWTDRLMRAERPVNVPSKRTRSRVRKLRLP